ncbi:unnamed protein product [Brassicogethes aeneus]|uniref:Ankyrin repeat domain-containing protein 54 n=1 Tax=Brassicogethes aeneus TaxID=1431903 RepID=A0A9P0AQZ6_BRAAE|nr:unnamed protein product [Brassicogethes aeneus]
MSCTNSEIEDDEPQSKTQPSLWKPHITHMEFKAKKKVNPDELKVIKRAYTLNKTAIDQGIKLIQAVNYNNTQEVEKLLDSGVDPNSNDRELRSALHIAVSKGYADIVELLLNYGADPNKRDVIQNTPLHLAVCLPNLAVITKLINAKADVRSINLHGRNPLELASSKLTILQRGWREGAIEMVKLRSEIRQVIDLLFSLFTRGLDQVDKLNTSDLQLMKLSLDTKKPEELDDDMSKLLSDIEKFKIA